MKAVNRMVCIALAIISIMLVVNSCTKKEQYSVKVSDFSDSNIGTKVEKEFYSNHGDRYVDSKAEQYLDFNVGNLQFSGTYYRSNVFYYYSTNMYIDSQNNTFSIDDKNRLVDFSIPQKNIPDGPTLTEDECVKIVSDFLNNLVDVNEYSMTVKYDEEEREYCITFQKYIGTLRTAERAIIRVKDSGYIRTFVSHYLGRISSTAEIDYDMEVVDSLVNQKLDQIYEDAKATYEEVQYSNRGYYVAQLNEKDLILRCTIEITITNHTETGQFERFSELIGLVIQ